jgi:hypothetical protein
VSLGLSPSLSAELLARCCAIQLFICDFLSEVLLGRLLVSGPGGA